MGKLVQVKDATTEVALPPLGLSYLGGETTTLTDAEYQGLSFATKNTLVVLQSGLADPVRSKNTSSPSTATDALKLSKAYTDEAIRGLSTLGLSPLPELATTTYVDTAIASSKAYADSKDAAQIAAEVTARNNADAVTLTSAINYTNTEIAAEVSRANLADATNLQTAKTYADNLNTSEESDRDSAIASAIGALNLNTASTHPATDFASFDQIATAVEGLAPAFPIANYTYNTDGTVATATEDGIQTSYAYNEDGTVHTATRAGVTHTYIYNSDGTVAGVS